MPTSSPIPANEFERVLDLIELDLDYTAQHESFEDLVKLAARVAGTEISLLNLIDSFTQWTISRHGMDMEQMPREDTVCQFTIMESDFLEVKNLMLDERFREKSYVAGDAALRYYFGVPLKTPNGYSIGALCMLDRVEHTLTPEKVELLKIIADEIVARLIMVQAINNLKYDLNEAKEVKKRVAHDIRGPIGGIIGLAQLISQRGEKNKLDDVLQFIKLIQKSGTSLLELADEILNTDVKSIQAAPELTEHELNLLVFKDKLEKLYLPQAKNKSISFLVNINPENGVVPFPKNKLLQITGNLISNAMKFTPVNGKVTVDLDLELKDNAKNLHIVVRDTGVGLDVPKMEAILNGTAASTDGTSGEQGYGFGLPLVKHLVDGLNGTLTVQSALGQGAIFDIKLPFN
ncbi:GAF domain-containing sensor histidine kinase [Pontibacter oryzae]|uniref:histidine kinase n=1 Tax=Pontibacter oryzae TaxID=2304593 RepID=A0A399SIX7_9BACT|nr:GAF domain-containing sensor histidine kinase [Pontibacter oryzae]RIJ41837.1 sensor histidine kinase [Pontibacter oryzae]